MSPRPADATSARSPDSAAIVAIGSELLGPFRQDTNSLWLTARLEEVGIRVVLKAIVGDDPAALREELDRAAAAAPLIFTTGGLGPTADDVTVAAVAEWLGAPLSRNEEFLAAMRARFERRGFPMPECNAKQADFIVGADVLANPRGTAPGFRARRGDAEIVILPGVPSEMREIFETLVLPRLRELTGGRVARRRVLRIAGMGESAVEQLVAPLYAKWSEDPVTILASPGEVQLHLVARGAPEEADRKLAEMEAEFRAVLGDRVFGEDADDLAAVVGRLLKTRGRTIALAESCTGGLVSTLLTDVPGSSEYFLGSVVSYANEAKERLLGVSAETLRAHGAVSAPSAAEMARGARERFDADLAVAITGIAGPDGGTAEKPVGTVFFAIASRDGSVLGKRRLLLGDRAVVRRTSALHALEMLRRLLLGAPEAA
jgi:nicotinamide-nucleotide amidase